MWGTAFCVGSQAPRADKNTRLRIPLPPPSVRHFDDQPINSAHFLRNRLLDLPNGRIRPLAESRIEGALNQKPDLCHAPTVQLWWQFLAPVAVMLTKIWAMIDRCSRIYSVGNLMYREKPNLPEIAKWLRGNNSGAEDSHSSSLLLIGDSVRWGDVLYAILRCFVLTKMSAPNDASRSEDVCAAKRKWNRNLQPSVIVVFSRALKTNSATGNV